MKRLIALAIASTILLLCLAGCVSNPGTSVEVPAAPSVPTYHIFSVKNTGRAVDTQLVDELLLKHPDFKNYSDVKEQYPDILHQLWDITPDAIRDKCTVYHFESNRVPLSLKDTTFLLYDGMLYKLGESLGGTGVTGLAYAERNGKEILYFVYNYGSGFHRVRVGAFDFATKQFTDSGMVDTLESSYAIDFSISDDGTTLLLKSANKLPGMTPSKDDHRFVDITTLDFKPLK